MRWFWDFVQRDSEDKCWKWLGATNELGYGIYKVGSRQFKAHRLTFEKHYGQRLPDDRLVCHKCDTPSCVNPAHLFLGSHEDNMRDMVRKGRSVYGEKNKHAKLTRSLVLEIRRRYSSGEPVASIARDMPVQASTVLKAAKGITWKKF